MPFVKEISRKKTYCGKNYIQGKKNNNSSVRLQHKILFENQFMITNFLYLFNDYKERKCRKLISKNIASRIKYILKFTK